jgi:hypothetical protein
MDRAASAMGIKQLFGRHPENGLLKDNELRFRENGQCPQKHKPISGPTNQMAALVAGFGN